MQGTEQLSPFSAAEGSGQPAMAGCAPHPRQLEEKCVEASVNFISVRKGDSSSSPSPQPSRVEKRARKASPSPCGSYLHPLPTIETMMTYPSLSRTVYDRLVRGEPPAQTYTTVIHTPKPPNMRVLDQNLLHTAEMSVYRRRKRSGSARSRLSTFSSIASPASGYSASGSLVGADSDSSTSDSSEPSSPVSVSSTSKATIASSTPVSPRCPLFPSFPLTSELQQPIYSPTPSTESDILNSYSDPPSREPSPAQSFHSTLSALSTELGPTSSSRSSAPSPASSAYPSPPSSPRTSRRSSSSEEAYMAYPSPPQSPQPSQQAQPQIQHRERRAFTFPPPSAPTPPTLTRSSSLSSHAWNESDASEYDLGEQKLGGGTMFDNGEWEDMEWSMNGGGVVFGAAGVAMSPRAMKGGCCACDHHDLRLYVIDEEEEPRKETN